MLVTLSSLRTQVRQKADMAYTQFVTDTELNGYINLSLAELYDLLIGAYQDYYIKGPTAFTVASPAVSASLPMDFYKLIALDYSEDGSTWSSMSKFTMAERNTGRGLYGRLLMAFPDRRYRILGANIFFKPEENSAGQYQIWYVPQVTQLVADIDTFDDINGWSEYVVLDAAIKCLGKEESDTTLLMTQKMAMKKRLEEMTQNRDAGLPARISDTAYSTYNDFAIPYMR